MREEGGGEAAALQAHAQDAVGLREHLRRVLGVPGARLDEEAHHRARRGDLEPLAADVAHEHARPRRSAASRRRRRRRRRPGARRARRSARARGRSAGRAARGGSRGSARGRSGARARTRARARSRRPRRRRARRAARGPASPKRPGTWCMALRTPNSRPPSAIGTCMNELTPCVSTTQRRKRSLSSASRRTARPWPRRGRSSPRRAGSGRASGARRRRSRRPRAARPPPGS